MKTIVGNKGIQFALPQAHYKYNEYNYITINATQKLYIYFK